MENVLARFSGDWKEEKLEKSGKSSVGLRHLEVILGAITKGKGIKMHINASREHLA